MTTSPKFNVVVAMLALDARDASVLDAVVECADHLHVHRAILVHVTPVEAATNFLGFGETVQHSDAPPPELAALAGNLRARRPDLEVDIRHGFGSPDEVLEMVIQKNDVDLLILGRNSAEGRPDGWGPNGQRLLRAVSCSALVVPQGQKVRFDIAFAGVDFSTHASFALQVAAQVAKRTVAVCQYDLRTAGHGSLTGAEFTARLTENARAHFSDVIVPSLPDGANVPALELIPGDRASDVLVERAGENLVVVGSRGLSRLASMFLGSTAERVAGHSVGPVLIVREKGRLRGLLDGLIHR